MTLPTPQPGQLFQVPKNTMFYFACMSDEGRIETRTSWAERHRINSRRDKTLFVLFIQFLFLEKTTQEEHSIWSLNLVYDFAIAAIRTTANDYDIADKQFADNRIPGGIYLSPEGKRIWISNIDIDKFSPIKS